MESIVPWCLASIALTERITIVKNIERIDDIMDALVNEFKGRKDFSHPLENEAFVDEQILKYELWIARMKYAICVLEGALIRLKV